ncbi:MAG: hypothetical protein KGZ83_06030 [Sulfuricella sp.]|nr:hypothetical protein [Sulfuricella sp.]
MRLRHLLLILLAMAAGLGHAESSLDVTTQLARSGAYQLAWQRVERDQPARVDDPQWMEWEALRLSLLVELQREPEVLQRIAGLPAVAAPLYLPAARAALQQSDPTAARTFTAKFLWSGQSGEFQLKEARRMVIRSYLAERRSDAAYLALLRYRQDYAPLADEETTAFGEQLLLAGGVTETANWLAQLAENTPLKLLVRMKTAQLSPEAAIAAARGAIEPPTPALALPDKSSRKPIKLAPPLPPAKPTGRELAGYWAIIGLAGEQLKNSALQVEALERRLNLAVVSEDGLFGARAATLWKVYEELGLESANRAQLLIGEDNLWLELAVNNTTAEPLAARGLFAFLARRGASAEIRNAGKVRLAAMLMGKGLDITAVRLFAGEADGEAPLLEQIQAADKARRSELLIAFGQAAAARGEHAQAAEYFLRASGTRAQRLAADSLMRADLPEDAQRLYEGLLKP